MYGLKTDREIWSECDMKLSLTKNMPFMFIHDASNSLLVFLHDIYALKLFPILFVLSKVCLFSMKHEWLIKPYVCNGILRMFIEV